MYKRDVEQQMDAPTVAYSKQSVVVITVLRYKCLNEVGHMYSQVALKHIHRQILYCLTEQKKCFSGIGNHAGDKVHQNKVCKPAYLPTL